MNAYIYIYKFSIGEGRPSWGWLKRCKWLYLRYVESEHFKRVLGLIERWGIPKVTIGRENRIKGYLVLKIRNVRGYLGIVGADVLHDALISGERLVTLEDGKWEIEVVRVTPRFYALWMLGAGSEKRWDLGEARVKFEALMKEFAEKTNEQG